MAIERTVHSFTGGLNQDLSKSKITPDKYQDAKNITVVLDDGSNGLSLTNVKGNTKKLTLPDLVVNGTDLELKDEDENVIQTIAFSTMPEVDSSDISGQVGDLRIIGYTTIRNTLVLVSRFYSTAAKGLIFTVDLDDYTITLKHISDLNFPMEPIQVIGNYESAEIQKIYIIDGTHEVRHLNIAASDTLTLTSSDLNLSPNTTFSNIVVTNGGGGGTFTAGKVQYAYSHYNKNGAESYLSSLTPFHSLSKAFNQGGEQGEELSESLSLQLTNIDTNWEYLKVYRLHYTSLDQDPTITLIKDLRISSSSLNFVDDGRLNLGSISTALFNAFKNQIIPKHGVAKDNRLFLANYKNKLFIPRDDSGNLYDVRAYSFIPDSHGSYTGDFTLNGSDDYTPDATWNWGVPIDDDAINDSLEDEDFGLVNTVAQNAWRKDEDGVTIPEESAGTKSGFGGTGPNVEYYYVYEDFVLDTDDTSKLGVVIDKTEDYVNKKSNNGKLSWQRDEIYRVAAVLKNTQGQDSPAMWIADIRIPSGHLLNPIYKDGNTTYARYIYPRFEFSNLPDDVASVRIVAVPRTDENKTVLSQGIVLPTIRYYTTDTVTDSDSSYSLYPYLGLVDNTSTQRSLLTWFSDTLNSNATLESDAQDVASPGPPIFVDTYNNYDREDCSFISLELLLNRSLSTTEGNYFSNEYVQAFTDYRYYGDYNAGYSGGSNTYLPSFLTDRANTKAFEQYYIAKVSEHYSFSAVNDKIQTPDEIITIEKNDDITFNNKQYYGQASLYVADFSGYGVGGNIDKQLLFNMPSKFTCDPISGLLSTDTNKLPIVNYKTPLLNQYGGQTYGARLNSEYKDVSDIETASSNEATVTANYGDTNISLVALLLAESNYSDFEFDGSGDLENKSSVKFSGSLGSVFLTALETQLNINFKSKLDPTSHYYQSGELLREWFVNDAQFLNDSNTLDLYKLHSGYNQLDNTKNYFSIDLTDIDDSFIETGIIGSDVKFNGEKLDAWLRLDPINVLNNIEGNYGPINGLIKFKDNVYFFQDTAVGALSINPKYQSATSSGNLIVGTGGVLDDYQYLSTNYGTTHRESIISSLNGIYFYDSYQKKIRRLGEDNAITDLKGMHSYLQNFETYSTNSVIGTGVTFGYNPKTNIVYFTFLGTTDRTFTFNENTGVFESFIDCNPLLWINSNELLSSYNTYEGDLDSLWLMNEGSRGKFFGTTYPSYVTFISNDNPHLVKAFNNAEWASETNDGSELTNSSWTAFQAWNNYQDTGEVNLRSFYAHHQFRKWRMYFPRNVSHITHTNLTTGSNSIVVGNIYRNPYTNYFYTAIGDTINFNYTPPSSGYMDVTKFTKYNPLLDRLRDFYCYIKFIYDNTDDAKFISHDIIVDYTTENKGFY